MKPLAIKVKIQRHTGHILDIGSGNNCLDIATHIIDLIPESNDEREGNLEAPPGKEFKAGSAEDIPYEAGFFDFVHAAHVLEHVSSPLKAAQEMGRVSKAGYIETPSAVIEQGIFIGESKEPGWDFHRWVAWSFPGGDTLFLKPKTSLSIKSLCSCPWGAHYAKITDKINLATLEPHIPYYCKMNQYVWTGSPKLQIWDEAQSGTFDPKIQRCTCQYSAFFAWGKEYFSSIRQLKRRFKFKKHLPEIYRIYKAAVQTKALS